MTELIKKIEFYPAYDKRHENPNKNYGIHGVNIKWLLIGEEVATQFLIFTNWNLKDVQDELVTKSLNRIRQGAGKFYIEMMLPMPADVGYHSSFPTYEGQESFTSECEYLGGKPCYYDGSGLQAEELYWQFVEHGEDAIWDWLQAEYDSLMLERLPAPA